MLIYYNVEIVWFDDVDRSTTERPLSEIQAEDVMERHGRIGGTLRIEQVGVQLEDFR